MVKGFLKTHQISLRFITQGFLGLLKANTFEIQNDWTNMMN